MANRRMINKTICKSAKFLKMPNEAQNLYFHLNLSADDDGVVEAFNVMREIGSNEDNLKILVAKNYVKILNEDLVSYILDWQKHNSIRADRKVDSLYIELLKESIPGIKLVEPKKRSDTKKGKKALQEEIPILPIENNGPTMDSPLDNQMTTNGQLRIGQDSEGQNRLIQNSTDKISIEENSLGSVDENILPITIQPGINAEEQLLQTMYANYLKEDIEGLTECIDYLKSLPLEVIQMAFVKAVTVKKPYWVYIKGILNSWIKKGIKTKEQVQEESSNFIKKNETNATTGFKRKGDEILNGQ